MKRYGIIILILLVACINSQSQQEKATTIPPYPETFGFDSGVLGNLIKTIREEHLNVNSVYIQRNKAVILDAHFYPQKATYLHDMASVSKSITSMLVGIAIDKGYIIGVDQKILDFFPNNNNLFNTEHKKGITIEHLLTMSSGLCSDFSKGEQMREHLKTSSSPIEDILSIRLSNKPGEQFTYCSVGVQLLSIIIETTSGMTLEDFANIHLFEPLKIEQYRFGTDVNGYSNASGDIYLTARDLAKVGQLILDKGMFDGNRIISEHYIKQSTTPKLARSNEESYGYLWWLRDDLGGLIEAQGRGGQRLIILPEKDMVIVMYGTGFEPGQIGQFIVEALKSDSSIAIDKEGYSILTEQLEAIGKPYAEKDKVMIPSIANVLCNKEFRFEENDIGFTHFTLCAENETNAFIILGLNIKKSNEIGERKVPLGLNGTYKISNATRFETPMAAMASWMDDSTIVIDYNEFSNAHKYQITIRFEGNQAIFKIKDEADYSNEQELIATSIN